MKYKRVLAVLLFMILLVFAGCENQASEVFDAPFFGPELYNASYVYTEGNAVKHMIPIMSKNDLSAVESVYATAKGATFTMTFELEPYEKKVGEYKLYKLILYFSDIVFTEEELDISEIRLISENDEELSVYPYKCQIVPLSGELNQNYININGAPLRIPMDMRHIPLELSKDAAATGNVTVKAVYLTNDSMRMYYDQNSDGSESDHFQEFLLGNESNIKAWKAMFETEQCDNQDFMQYGTSIIVEYEYEGQRYVAVPAVPYTIYNPFDINYESIDLYCAWLGVAKS